MLSNRIGLPLFVNPTKIELYESPNIVFSLTGGSLFTWTHNLGKKLRNVEMSFVCVIASQGYVVGEEIKYGLENWTTNAAGQEYGGTLSVTENDVTFQAGNISSWAQIARKSATAGDFISIGTPDWAIKFRGELITIGDIPDITRVGLVPLEKKVVASDDADVQFNLVQYFNDYEDYILDIRNLGVLTDSQNVFLRTSADGTTFDSGISDYQLSALYNNQTTPSGILSSTSSMTISVGRALGTGTQEFLNCELKIINADDPGHYTIIDNLGSVLDYSAEYKSHHARHTRVAAAQVKAVQIFSQSGNLAQGTLILYGKRKVA
jgi:hypothetical protein